MSEHDSETFARFARRFRAIEGEIGDPPPPAWSDGGTPRRLRSGSLLRATAVIAVVVVLAVLSPFLAGRSGPPPNASGSTAGGGAATSSAPASSPSPSESDLVPLDPVTAPEELQGPCLTHTTVFDRARTTLEQDAAMSSVVVIGTITEIGEAQWNTTDGRAPKGHDIEPSQVLRLLRVTVESVVKGTSPSVVTAWIPGGQIGCHGFAMGGFADAQVGGHYVFFLNETSPRNGISGASAAWQTWSIAEDSVVTSFDGNLPLDLFVERASHSQHVGEWSAACGGVPTGDCEGVAALFVGNLARNWHWVFDESGGKLSVTPRPECPSVPDWADPSFCWQATADTTSSGPICMVIARQLEPYRSGARFGQVGGDEMAGRAGVPPHGWPACE